MPSRASLLTGRYAHHTGDVQPSFAGVRTTMWKRVRYPDPSDDELLDLATDPYELQSKPPDPRQIARRLDHRLRDAQR
jgi:arylsulfatase A-like enzyme